MHRYLLSLLILAAPCVAHTTADDLRPPSIPLVAHDPYFSVWSPADRLTDTDTTHWTGAPQPLRSLIRVDGRTFRLMGAQPADTPVLAQEHVRVLPTRTIYRFANEQIGVTLTFLTPALPSNLEVLSRPVTYITWDVCSRDGHSHDAQVYFECGGEIAVNTVDQQVVWDRPPSEELTILRIGSEEQPVLGKKGDNLRIDWGYAYLAAPSRENPQAVIQDAAVSQAAFLSNGQLPGQDAEQQPRAVQDGHPVMAMRLDLPEVTQQPKSCWLMLGYDDVAAIRYFRSQLQSYWARNGAHATDVLRAAADNYSTLAQQCDNFDGRIMHDLTAAGGEHYAQLSALAYRQTLAGNKIVADANGMPLMFPKENFSNGCIGTVDVLYPQAPFYLLLSPALTKAMLVPLLDYASSWRWTFSYAPHDLGTYPFATGQVYGGGEHSDQNQMPVEETGNMLIMMSALSQAEGHAKLAEQYWPLLTQWADYLVREGFDPTNQLCTADMFGHLAHNADLSLKAIIGIGGYAQMCAMLGRTADSDRYLAIARDYAAKWQQLADDNDHTRLAFDKPGTWGMKHNLIWDRILGLDLFPASVGDQEIGWYLQVQNRFGLACDNRTDQSLIDWAVWCISLARNDRDWQTLFEPLYRYVHETPQRVAMADWFDTKDGARVGFQARPVVGGIFMRLLSDQVARKKWVAEADTVAGSWAQINLGAPKQTIVPTSQLEGIPWRYSLAQPPADWYKTDFDDSTWQLGPGGFGTAGTPNAVVRTEWKTSDIWLRREFELPNGKLTNPVLLVHYDEAPEIYLNGILAAQREGYTTGYEELEISPAARDSLKPGTNRLAVRASQTWGGQYIDVGLAVDEQLLSVRKLFDFPVRDTSICLGPDGNYYLTGTTGFPDWWKTNEGIRIWKSADLNSWQPLGLVWSFAEDATWQKELKENRRAIWAPEIHYMKGTFWLSYCLNWPSGGTGLLRSTTGKPEGPYADVNPTGPITQEIDASLFQDDDGTVYFIFQNGKIAKMKEDMSGLAEHPRLLAPLNAAHVGFEGAFLTKIDGRYQLICAEFNSHEGYTSYDCMSASADQIYGPYGQRYLAIPHAGHNMLLQDKEGHWWSTFFGNDPHAPWRERPGILPIHLNSAGHITTGPDAPPPAGPLHQD